MTIAVDGQAKGIIYQSPFTSPLVLHLTTRTAHDVILLGIAIINGGTTTASITGVSGGGLSWSQRATEITGTASGIALRAAYYWAPAPSILSNTAISISFSGPCFISAFAIAISGTENYLIPFDSNIGLPFAKQYFNPTIVTMDVGPFNVTTNGGIGVITQWDNDSFFYTEGTSQFGSWGDALVESTSSGIAVEIALGCAVNANIFFNQVMTNGFREYLDLNLPFPQFGFSPEPIPGQNVLTVPRVYFGFKGAAISTNILPYIWVAT